MADDKKSGWYGASGTEDEDGEVEITWEPLGVDDPDHGDDAVEAAKAKGDHIVAVEYFDEEDDEDAEGE